MNQNGIQSAEEILAVMNHKGEIVGTCFCLQKAIKSVINLRDLGFIYDLYSQQYFKVNRHGEIDLFDITKLKPMAESAPDRHGMEE